jgi:hypothetical protein
MAEPHKTFPNPGAEKWGQKYSAGVNLLHLSAPNLSAK